MASMGIYVFTRRVLIDMLERREGVDFGRKIIPASLPRYRVRSYFYRGYWADVGTIESFYAANVLLTHPKAPFTFYDPKRPIYTHPRFLPPSRFNACRIEASIVAEGCYMDDCVLERSVIGIRTRIDRGTRITRSVLLGADDYDGDPETTDRPRLGIGRDSVLDGVIVDKNARIGHNVRLVNDGNVREADNASFYIRNGIVIIPKGAVVPSGTRIGRS